jgi:arginyl-tRNA--protein-N-Asp/Glu arginylyltransferase
MKLIADKFNSYMRIYQLGELVLNCPKVNYKLNYKPGKLICPRTKKMVYYNDVKEKIVKYSRMSMKYKKE